jgi:hypothetical protein
MITRFRHYSHKSVCGSPRLPHEPPPMFPSAQPSAHPSPPPEWAQYIICLQGIAPATTHSRLFYPAISLRLIVLLAPSPFSCPSCPLYLFSAQKMGRVGLGLSRPCPRTAGLRGTAHDLSFWKAFDPHSFFSRDWIMRARPRRTGTAHNSADSLHRQHVAPAEHSSGKATQLRSGLPISESPFSPYFVVFLLRCPF